MDHEVQTPVRYDNSVLREVAVARSLFSFI